MKKLLNGSLLLMRDVSLVPKFNKFFVLCRLTDPFKNSLGFSVSQFLAPNTRVILINSVLSQNAG